MQWPLQLQMVLDLQLMPHVFNDLSRSKLKSSSTKNSYELDAWNKDVSLICANVRQSYCRTYSTALFHVSGRCRSARRRVNVGRRCWSSGYGDCTVHSGAQLTANFLLVLLLQSVLMYAVEGTASSSKTVPVCVYGSHWKLGQPL